MKLLKSLLLTIPILLFFISCGYRPISHYSKNVISGSSYIEVDVNLNDPKNMLIIKDELIDIFLTKLKTNISDSKDRADNIFTINYEKIKFKPIRYDDYGYVTVYRADLNLIIDYEINNGAKKGRIESYGNYSFSIDKSNVVSDIERFKAIKYASYEAIDEFISRLSLMEYKFE
jgi:hypothetical protein